MNPCDFLLRDGATGQWLRFADPVLVLVAWTPEEVVKVLDAGDRALDAGRWVAGMVSYEAAPAFDPVLRVRPDGSFPLAVLGVFDGPRIEAPPPPVAPMDGPDLTALRPGVSEKAFSASLQAIHAAIREGDTYQVNFTYRLRSRLRSSPADLFRHLVSGQSATYAAWARIGPWAVASASPELFFRKDGDRVVSRPMKGTAGRGPVGPGDRGAAETLLASRKERAENLMIVDMVRNDLALVSRPGSVKVPELFTLEAYPTVWQLTSLVESRSSASLSGLFRALFPAASITGAPKTSTMELIARLENSPRRVYTGALGFAAPDGTMQFNVAIRTALVDTRTGRLEYGVGGGIVWDSDPGREWVETRTKARILRRPPPGFDLLETLRWDPGTGYGLLDRHVARLLASAASLGFDVDGTVVRGALERHASRFEGPTRVRLTVDRAGRCVVTDARLEPAPAFVRPRLAIAPAALSSADPFLRHKTTNREPYDRMRALCPDADDVILWNERGEVTETTWSNVFVESEGLLLTPPLTSGPLAGTFRDRLIEEGRAVERTLHPEDLLSAGRVWLGNSVRGLYEAGHVTDARPGRSVTV